MRTTRTAPAVTPTPHNFPIDPEHDRTRREDAELDEAEAATPAPAEDYYDTVAYWEAAEQEAVAAGYMWNADTARQRIAMIKAVAAAVALALCLSLTSQPASAQTVPPDTYTRGCVQSGTTGEGFPVMSCPEDGATYYIDMDGDGFDSSTNGRWIILDSRSPIFP